MSRVRVGGMVTGVLAALFLVVGYGFGVIWPPSPERTVVTIERGMNAEEIARRLKEAGVIRSRIFFVWAAYGSGLQNRLGAGSFEFSGTRSTFSVLEALLTQRDRTVLITEGSTIADIAQALLDAGMPAGQHFAQTARSTHPEGRGSSMEGFLFPDTYRFFEAAPPEEIVRIMYEEFKEKIRPLESDIASSGRSLYDIVTVASIIEREVQTPQDKAIVSGILWKRLQNDMPLQVDATLFYITGRASHELTPADLENDSPYNTYEHKGLPPTPVSNPGIESIEAALRPSASPYLFYLSGRDGTTHYARTFDEHRRNKERYLR